MKTGARTVTGKTLGENLAGFKVTDEETIRPVTRPLGTHPTIVMLRGSLSPETSIVKLSVTEQRNLQLRGPAVVFETALEAIERHPGRQGQRRSGRRGARAGAERHAGHGRGLGSVVFAVLGAGLAGKVAVVTDGQLSGLTNVGITVAEVAPEAAAGGPIGLVENGDIIAIDVAKRTADLEVSEAELEKRRAKLSRWATTSERGWLAMYRDLVEPVGKGRILRR